MLRRLTTFLGVMLVLTAGCGMGDNMAAPSSPSSTAAGDTASSAPGASPGQSAVPDVVVRDVATGADVNVRTAVARPDRPTLYWFWAPH